MQEKIFFLIGGLGIFLYGIKLMGDSLKAYAGDDLREIINRYTSNPFKGVLVGIMSTVAIQSSSGTTALTISLVRAGLMDLRQAVGVIMGANIGTTVTAFLLGLKIKDYALPIMFVGALIYMFTSNRKKSLIGQIIFGFGALFFGMALMEMPLKELAQTPGFEDMMLSVGNNPLLGVLIGAGLTMLVQSSSATIGILQSLYAAGAFTFPVATAILLGDNIGTTITSLLASMGGSRDSKRAALSHVIFNIFGSVLFYFLLFGVNLIVPYDAFIEHNGLTPELQIAFTHFFFNVSVTLMLIWFVPQLVWLVKKIVPVGDDEIKVNIQEHYLDEKLINDAPTLALEQAKTSLLSLASTVEEQMKSLIDYIEEPNKKSYEQVIQLEIGVNAVDKKLKHFLNELSGHEMTLESSKELNLYMYTVNEYERIGDLCEKTIITLHNFAEERNKLSDDAKEEVIKMLKVGLSSLNKTISLFETGDITLVGRIIEKEKQLDRMERKYYKAHLRRVKHEDCTGKLAVSYVDMISDLERIGDHTQNITEYYTNANQILTEAEEEFDLAEIIS